MQRLGISESGDRHVFSSQTHEHMTTSCIREIYDKYVRMAKEATAMFCDKSYTPHSMRHSTATHMLEAGAPLIVIKNFLGYSSLQSTQIYAEVTQNTLNKHIKEWSKKWGPITDCIDDAEHTPIIPDFLNTKNNPI